MICPKCGVETIYIEEQQACYCPKCGELYKDIKLLENIDFDESNNVSYDVEADVKYVETKSSQYAKMATPYIVSTVISLLIFIICFICQFTSITALGILLSRIFSMIFAFVFQCCLVLSIIYICIDKYHVDNIYPMQDEISELRKEIEDLKNKLNE